MVVWLRVLVLCGCACSVDLLHAAERHCADAAHLQRQAARAAAVQRDALDLALDERRQLLALAADGSRGDDAVGPGRGSRAGRGLAVPAEPGRAGALVAE